MDFDVLYQPLLNIILDFTNMIYMRMIANDQIRNGHLGTGFILDRGRWDKYLFKGEREISREYSSLYLYLYV